MFTTVVFDASYHTIFFIKKSFGAIIEVSEEIQPLLAQKSFFGFDDCPSKYKALIARTGKKPLVFVAMSDFIKSAIPATKRGMTRLISSSFECVVIAEK